MIRKNVYVGWHTDDEFIEADKEVLPGILQCNIYFQDNAKKNGGGIDISPGSHRLDKIKKKEIIKENTVSYETIKTQTGDLLIFDYRVIHRSSIAAIQDNTRARLALQWTVCKSEEKANMFLQYLARRQEEKLHLADFTDKRALKYFFDAANVEYPYSFDLQAQKIIELSNIIVPSFKQIGKI